MGRPRQGAGAAAAAGLARRARGDDQGGGQPPRPAESPRGPPARPPAGRAMTAQARAWGWVAHLTSGGTTPWADWTDDGSASRAGVLPGAQHLELLRRLNLAGPTPTPLVRRVLASGAPGRGQQELGLVGVAEPGRYGAPPVDPADLPDDELVRLASGVLADLVVSAPEPAPPRNRRPRLFRHEYRLGGNRLTADALRAQLIRDGRPPGGTRPTVVMLLGDLGAHLADTWAARVRRAFAPPWDDWIHELAEIGRASCRER